MPGQLPDVVPGAAGAATDGRRCVCELPRDGGTEEQSPSNKTENKKKAGGVLVQKLTNPPQEKPHKDWVWANHMMRRVDGNNTLAEQRTSPSKTKLKDGGGCDWYSCTSNPRGWWKMEQTRNDLFFLLKRKTYIFQFPISNFHYN